jgi:DNA mismatch repair protein MutL
VFQLFGPATFDDMAPVEGGSDWARVRGLVARPDRPGGRRTLRLFVNGRSVRDRALARAVAEGYGAAGAGEPRGDAILFVDAPLHLVDVNVHPAKTEVRFAEPRAVWIAVETAVRDALSAVARAGAPRAEPRRGSAASVAGAAADTGSRGARDTGGRAATDTGGAGLVGEPRADAPYAALPLTIESTTDALAPLPDGRTGSAAIADDEALSVLGQHRRIYIVASDGEDLVLLDQHTAHERVRFEALLERVALRRVESQRLLVPQVVELPPALRPVLESHREGLLEMGFDVEPFGGSSLRVAGLPALLGGRDPGQALLGTLSDLLERESGEWAVANERERLAATLACHSAVRAGQALSLEAMRSIAAELARTRQPSLCPHGRPTRVRVPREDITRWFGRAGWRRQ